MTDPIKTDFDAAQFAAVSALAAERVQVSFAPVPGAGPVPSRFMAELRTIGLARNAAGQKVEEAVWAFGISPPANYLRGRDHSVEIVTDLGAWRQPGDEQIRPAFVY